MSKITTQTTVTIRLADGQIFSVTEEKTVTVTDNVRYLGESVYFATTELAERFRPIVEHRFGSKPE